MNCASRHQASPSAKISDSRQSKGAQYEQEALVFLRRQGLKLVEKNYRSRYGEIDLIMRHRRCLTFIEVRFRGANRLQPARASVDKRKQAKIIKTAQIFVAQNARLANETMRFDVVAFDATGKNAGGIQWIQDAFRA